MQRMLTLGVVLSLVVMFAGAALAGDLCSYSTHTQKVVAEKATTVQPPATQTTPPTDPEKVIVAQTEQPAKPAPATTNK